MTTLKETVELFDRLLDTIKEYDKQGLSWIRTEVLEELENHLYDLQTLANNDNESNTD